MTIINRSANPNGRSNWFAQFKVVAVNPITSKYLHMSGVGETSERAFAWVGQQRQFENMAKMLDVEYDLQSAQLKSWRR